MVLGLSAHLVDNRKVVATCFELIGQLVVLGLSVQLVDNRKVVGFRLKSSSRT